MFLIQKVKEWSKVATIYIVIDERTLSHEESKTINTLSTYGSKQTSGLQDIKHSIALFRVCVLKLKYYPYWPITHCQHRSSFRSEQKGICQIAWMKYKLGFPNALGI